MSHNHNAQLANFDLASLALSGFVGPAFGLLVSMSQGGGIGRRARLRNLKSLPSKRFFAFQKTVDLRGKTHFVMPEVVITNDEQKSARSSTKLVHKRARLYFLRVRLPPDSAPATLRRLAFTLLALQRLSALPRQRVSESADRFAADRTSDRAGAAQE